MVKRMLPLAAIVLSAAPALALRQAGDPDRGLEVYGGLGVGNYAQDLGDVTSSGLAWGARAAYLPFRAIGLEIAYQGLSGDSNTIITPTGTLTDENVTQTQFTGNAKIGWPVMIMGGEREIVPYGLIGAGINWISTPDILQDVGLGDSTAFAMPVGGGVSFDITRVFSIDGRFAWNFLFGIDDQPLTDNSADSWALMVNLGAVLGGAPW